MKPKTKILRIFFRNRITFKRIWKAKCNPMYIKLTAASFSHCLWLQRNYTKCKQIDWIGLYSGTDVLWTHKKLSLSESREMHSIGLLRYILHHINCHYHDRKMYRNIFTENWINSIEYSLVKQIQSQKSSSLLLGITIQRVFGGVNK